MYRLKFLFINRFTKNKMHTVPLHASKQQLRGIFFQGHMSRSRSLQKSRKTVYRLKFLFINRFTKNKMHTVPLHTSKQQLRGIFSQGHRSRSRSLQKSQKNGVPFKIFIYQPIHEKQNAYRSPPRQQAAAPRNFLPRS